MAGWTYSPQVGIPGHCDCAQVWGDDGKSLAVTEPTTDARVAIERARLISAAPELLGVLHTTAGNLRSIIAASNHRQYDEWLATVDAVIAKAEGR